jgi:hypothetical protein
MPDGDVTFAPICAEVQRNIDVVTWLSALLV